MHWHRTQARITNLLQDKVRLVNGDTSEVAKAVQWPQVDKQSRTGAPSCASSVPVTGLKPDFVHSVSRN